MVEPNRSKSMKLKNAAIIAMGLVFGAITSTSAQRAAHVKNQQTPLFGTFYSLTLNQPPFPFNPFPELPVYSIGDGKFVYDDRSVDYLQLRAGIAAIQEEQRAMQLKSGEADSGAGLHQARQSSCGLGRS